ncbi:unnamed protein product, partial [Iphiclides podalirius]
MWLAASHAVIRSGAGSYDKVSIKFYYSVQGSRLGRHQLASRKPWLSTANDLYDSTPGGVKWEVESGGGGYAAASLVIITGATRDCRRMPADVLIYHTSLLLASVHGAIILLKRAWLHDTTNCQPPATARGRPAPLTDRT